MNRATILILAIFLSIIVGYGLGYLKWGRKPKQQPATELPKPE